MAYSSFKCLSVLKSNTLPHSDTWYDMASSIKQNIVPLNLAVLVLADKEHMEGYLNEVCVNCND